jgi:hypothetical protein
MGRSGQKRGASGQCHEKGASIAIHGNSNLNKPRKFIVHQGLDILALEVDNKFAVNPCEALLKPNM